MTTANHVPRPDTLLSRTTHASARPLPPVRISQPTSPRMPPSRGSSNGRPQSPLSSRYEPSNRFDAYRPPSPRRAVGNNQRRANTQSLKLPSLPRFHPANYPPSHHNSTETTPDGPGGSSNSLSSSSSQHHLMMMSGRSHQRVYSDAQKHLMAYQHDMISAAVRASSPNRLDEPDSPKLVPMGSPGPVTPLELEAEEGYLVAGARSAGKETSFAPQDLVDEMIRLEANRRGRAAPRSPKGR